MEYHKGLLLVLSSDTKCWNIMLFMKKTYMFLQQLLTQEILLLVHFSIQKYRITIFSSNPLINVVAGKKIKKIKKIGYNTSLEKTTKMEPKGFAKSLHTRSCKLDRGEESLGVFAWVYLSLYIICLILSIFFRLSNGFHPLMMGTTKRGNPFSCVISFLQPT